MTACVLRGALTVHSMWVVVHGVTGTSSFDLPQPMARSSKTSWFQRWTPSDTHTWWTSSFSTNGIRPGLHATHLLLSRKKSTPQRTQWTQLVKQPERKD